MSTPTPNRPLWKRLLRPIYLRARSALGWFFDIFSPRKAINITLLNRLGVQPFRAIVSRSLQHERLLLRKISGRQLSAEAKQLHDNGYVVISNFLPPDVFRSVVHEYETFIGRMDDRPIDDTGAIKHYFQDCDWERDAPTIFKNLLNSECILATFAGADGTTPNLVRTGIRGSLWLDEKIEESKPAPGLYRDYSFHSDTFHSAYKAFLYLDDIEQHLAPFSYCSKSHRLDWERLKFEYRYSNGIRAKSPYADEQVLERLAGTDVVMCVPANTLVVVNTFGMHRRGLFGEIGDRRRAILIGARLTPFRFL